MGPAVWVGVLRVRFRVPGARTLKDRRRPTRMLIDRLRNKFSCAVADVGSELPVPDGAVAVAFVGEDPAAIRPLIDRVSSFTSTLPHLLIVRVDEEIRRCDLGEDWGRRMMAELGDLPE